MLPVDKNNPEDVDTHAEDHAYDALRYGCMSRPSHPMAFETRMNDIKMTSGQTYKPSDSVFGY